jgi:hypothetical protein
MTDLDSIKGWQSDYFLVLASKRVLKEHSSVVLFIKEIVPWTLNTRYYHVGTIGYRVLHVIVPWTLNRFPKIPEPLYKQKEFLNYTRGPLCTDKNLYPGISFFRCILSLR